MSIHELKLRPQRRLDGKWVKISPETIFEPATLSHMWNELVQTNELGCHSNDGLLNNAGHIARKGITGKYYCGLKVLNCACCDGHCVPNNCNCLPCQALDAEEKSQHERFSCRAKGSPQIMNSWTWKRSIGKDDLLEGVKALLVENSDLANESARCTLSTTSLTQRLIVLERYLIALNHRMACSGDSQITKSKLQATEANRATQKKNIEPQELMKAQLATVGSQTALSFAFAFLKRAWRSGEDTDLCCNLLQECTDTMRLLPDACLFDKTQVSKIWYDMMTRTSRFLKTVITEEITQGAEGSRVRVPTEDQRKALALYCELAIQRGSITDVLDMALLLWDLWQSAKNDNRVKGLSGAPLVSLITRFQSMKSCGDDDLQRRTLGSQPFSPTTCFLRYLQIPDDVELIVDLQQACVMLMCHIDRLVKPYLPKPTQTESSATVTTLSQCEVYGWGWLAWNLGADLGTPHLVEALNDLSGVKQLACSLSCIHVLTTTGRVYVINYSSEMQKLDLVNGLSNHVIVRISSHFEAKHYLALSSTGVVFTWGNGDCGQLGHKNTRSLMVPTPVEALRNKKVTKIFCGPEQSAAILDSGELYVWGKGQGYPNSTDQLVPDAVVLLHNVQVTQISFGCNGSPTLVLDNKGRIFAYGENDLTRHCTGLTSRPTSSWKVIETIQDVPMSKVACGENFCLLLSQSGHLYSWGTGNSYRLGHGNEENITTPKQLAFIKSRIHDICVGPKHCIAITEQGQVR